MIIFVDLDGTLLDVSEKYYRLYLECIAGNGAKRLTKKRYWDLKRSKTPDYDILRETSSEHIYDEFIKKRNHLIESRRFLATDTVWPELHQIFDKLFRKNRTILITLRKRKEEAVRQLKHLGIYSWFDTILSAPEQGNKERWRMKVDMIRALGVLDNTTSSDYLFLGDTETDILAGKHLNMKTIGVSFGIRKRDVLFKSQPDLLFDEPIELADYLKETYL